jgi:protein-S-isoprenylcysteine O-methyltransferase Ste14
MKTTAYPLAPSIPPLVVALLAGLGAWLAAQAVPALRLDSDSLPVIAAAVGLLGVGCSLLGVVSFRRARTTVNPLNPGAATALVVSGVYRFTRNPMYLGFLLVLLGEVIWLGSLLALAAAPAFVIYLNRCQIAPEEYALRERFGAEFNAYTARVPRWL